MIAYVGKQSIEIKNHYLLHRVADELKELGIEGLLPVFHNKEKAEKFCGESNYIILGTDKSE